MYHFTPHMLRLYKLFLLAASSFVFACNGPDSSAPSAPSDTLSILSFNVLYGGDELDFAKVAEAIHSSGADIAGIQEAEGRLADLAKAVGWRYYDERTHVISKYPLFSPPEGGRMYLYAMKAPGKVVAIANIHLPSDPYGPEAVRDGIAPDSLQSLENQTLMTMLLPYLKALPELVESGIPVFLTGDFNAPSHLDWTASAVGHRFHVRYAVEWPISKAIAAAGFTDAFRSIYPDPVQKPGLTWTPGFPSQQVSMTETHDRIDFIWVSRQVHPIGARIIGEAGGPDVDIPIEPYPSDHRAVLSICEVQAVTPPAFIAASPRLSGGSDTLEVGFVSRKAAAHQVHIKSVETDSLYQTHPFSETLWTGNEKIALQHLPPGKYQLLLLGLAGDTLAQNTFWVKDVKAGPQIAIPKQIFASGEPIPVSWKDAPGYKYDWIAVYPASADATQDYGKVHSQSQYQIYRYTEAEIAGSLVLDQHASGDFWPLKPGDYRIHLMLDDGFTSLASVALRIK